MINMIDKKEYRTCKFCKFYICRTREEYFNCESNKEIERFDGYCRRYPKKEEVKRNYLCGEWKGKKDNCRFKNDDGTCDNNYFMKDRLCKNLECGLDVL